MTQCASPLSDPRRSSAIYGICPYWNGHAACLGLLRESSLLLHRLSTWSLASGCIPSLSTNNADSPPTPPVLLIPSGPLLSVASLSAWSVLPHPLTPLGSQVLRNKWRTHITSFLPNTLFLPNLPILCHVTFLQVNSFTELSNHRSFSTPSGHWTGTADIFLFTYTTT